MEYNADDEYSLLHSHCHRTHYFLLTSFAELYKMVCEPDETDLDIHIPAVMLPQDAGASLEKMLLNSSSGK